MFFKLPPKWVAKETHIDDLVMWYVQKTILWPMHNNSLDICTVVYHYYFYVIAIIFIIYYYYFMLRSRTIVKAYNITTSTP